MRAWKEEGKGGTGSVESEDMNATMYCCGPHVISIEDAVKTGNE